MIRQTLAYVAYSVLLLVLLLTLLVSQPASLPSSLSRVEPGLFALLPLARAGQSRPNPGNRSHTHSATAWASKLSCTAHGPLGKINGTCTSSASGHA